MIRAIAGLIAAVMLLPAAAHAQRAPAITAPAGIVVEATTGDVAWQKEADTRRSIASTTKLMTALVVLEEADLDAVVNAPRYRATSTLESVMGLVPGERITIRDLLRGLLVDSANDAAYALALKVGGTVPQFVRRMNERAQELGLENTSFANPIGLDDPDNYSTARDLAALTLVLRKNALFREIVDSETITLESGARPRTLENTNTLLGDQAWVDGVKTGQTSSAGEVLVASGRRGGIPIVTVVMGAETKELRDSESLELLTYGFGRYERYRAVTEDELVRELPIVDRDGAELRVIAARSITRITRKGAVVDEEITLPEKVEGPISYRQKLGELVLRVGDRQVARVPLVSALSVPKAGTARKLQNLLLGPWTLLVLGAILLGATYRTQRRTSTSGRERTA